MEGSGWYGLMGALTSVYVNVCQNNLHGHQQKSF